MSHNNIKFMYKPYNIFTSAASLNHARLIGVPLSVVSMPFGRILSKAPVEYNKTQQFRLHSLNIYYCDNSYLLWTHRFLKIFSEVGVRMLGVREKDSFA